MYNALLVTHTTHSCADASMKQEHLQIAHLLTKNAQVAASGMIKPACVLAQQYRHVQVREFSTQTRQSATASVLLSAWAAVMKSSIHPWMSVIACV